MTWPSATTYPGEATYPGGIAPPPPPEPDAMLTGPGVNLPIPVVYDVLMARDTGTRTLQIPGRADELINHGTTTLRRATLTYLFHTYADAAAVETAYLATAPLTLTSTGLGAYKHVRIGELRIRPAQRGTPAAWELSVLAVERP